MRGVLVVPTLALALAGCMAERLEALTTQLSVFVNRSEAELVRELGVPTRTFEADGSRFLAYARTRRVVYPGWDAWDTPWGWRRWSPPPQVVDYPCEATFESRGGRVVGVQVRGSGC